MRQIGIFLNSKILMSASTALPTGLVSPGVLSALDVNISADLVSGGRDAPQNNMVNPIFSIPRTTHQSREPDNGHDNTADQHPNCLVGRRVGENSGNIGAD
jgi:hypothetical protein